MTEYYKSLDAEAANATGTVFDVSQTGEYNLAAYGTWDGATVTFYVSVDEDQGKATNGFTDANVTFTQNGGYNANLRKGAKIWAATTSVGTSALTASISKGPIT